MNELVCFALVAFFPRVDDLPGLAELGVNAKVARLRRESTPLFWLGVVAAAFLFQLSPILTVHRPWPAVLLSDEQLDRHASKLAAHPFYVIRQLMVLLKLVAGLFWGESPEIRAQLHLSPYPADPGTRRTEPMVPPPVLEPRVPDSSLVALGRQEQTRGRGVHQGDLDAGRLV